MTELIKIYSQPEGPPKIDGCLYAVLGLSKKANAKQILKAYRLLSKKYHPDRNPGDPEAAKLYTAIDTAYWVLGDPDRKKLYDETGAYDGQQAWARSSNRLHRIGEMVSSLIMQTVDQLTEQEKNVEQIDLIRMMRGAVKASIEGSKNELKTYVKSCENLKKLKGRFSTKKKEDEEKNVVEGALEFRIKAAKDRVEHYKEDLKDQEELYEHLEIYVYKFTKTPPVPDMDNFIRVPWDRVTITPTNACGEEPIENEDADGS